MPDRYFDLGARRLRHQRLIKRGPIEIVFAGRLTHRKGYDILVDKWPAWSDALTRSGFTNALHVCGRDFRSAVHRPPAALSTLRDAGYVIRWSPNLGSALRRINGMAIGLNLSRQEFDGIATSEMSAMAIPVVTTNTLGGLALNDESSSVLVVNEPSHVSDALAEVIGDYWYRAARGRDGIRKTRSMQAVGRAVAGLAA